MNETEAKSPVQVIDRMMRLLDALARHSSALSLKELSAETGLHPSTAHRILGVMVQNRVVNRIAPGTYRLGMRLFELGSMVHARIGARQEAFPYMQQLQTQTGETIQLAVKLEHEIVYVEQLSAATSTPDTSLIGTKAPLHATAAGKIFLAASGIEGCLDYIQRTGLIRRTAHTITDQDALLLEIEAIMQKGYAIEREEAQSGIFGVAAGIYDSERRLTASIALTCRRERYNENWGTTLKQVAERISRAGGTSGAPE